MAPAPSSLVQSLTGTVRAETMAEANEVSSLLETLQPALLELLPGSRELDNLDVWIQDEPTLYAYPSAGTSDAEGLWAESHNRILLARGADNLQRTLAHELVHAHLGKDWNTLPGTLEEGLCDRISEELAPEGAARLRAGRLASAALLCGSIQLELKVRETGSKEDWSARIALSGGVPEEEPQRAVFRLAAGLSSTRLEASAKRGYYGMAYLLVDRVVSRRGLEGLHALCVRAADEGFDAIPRPWLLEAAELEDEREDWGRAAMASMGSAELAELIKMHPNFAIDALAKYLNAAELAGTPAEQLAAIEADLWITDSETMIDLDQHPIVREAVLARLTAR
ncbi:MAG: hypothetical protein ACI8QC_002353 [Planctomycetota bacterium]|jgi:hypothetical protein